MMKTIFIIQYYAINNRINYHAIAQPEKYQLYLIVFGAPQLELNNFIEKNYNIFLDIRVIKKLDVQLIKNIIANYVLHNDNNITIVTNSEAAVGICGQLRQQFNLDLDDMLRYVDKLAMKAVLKQHVKLPKYIEFSNEIYLKNPDGYVNEIHKILNLPLFIKPIDQYSSQNTLQINQINEFHTWHSTHNSHHNFEIDEVITGTLFHCDTFIKDGTIFYTQVCEYLYPCYDFILGKPLGSFMLPTHTEKYKRLANYNNFILNKLGIPSAGLTNLEVFERENGEFIFLEIAARPPGAQLPLVYQRTLNIAIREAHLLLQIDPDYKPLIKQSAYGAFLSFPIKKGYVTQLNTPQVNSHYQLIWNVKPGDLLQNPNKISDMAANIILWNNDYQTLLQDVN